MSAPEEQESPSGAPASNRDPAMLKGISDAMVGLYKEQFGRGPTRTRTEWAGADTLVVTLEQTLTRPERHLVSKNEHERLRDLRMYFQYAFTAEFCEPVERLTGRKVRAFVSGIDTYVDGLSTELFVLHPPGSDAVSRGIVQGI